MYTCRHTHKHTHTYSVKSHVQVIVFLGVLLLLMWHIAIFRLVFVHKDSQRETSVSGVCVCVNTLSSPPGQFFQTV